MYAKAVDSMRTSSSVTKCGARLEQNGASAETILSKCSQNVGIGLSAVGAS